MSLICHPIRYSSSPVVKLADLRPVAPVPFPLLNYSQIASPYCDIIVKWSNNHNFLWNASMRKELITNFSGTKENPAVIDGDPKEWVPSFKYLGFSFNKTLKCQGHVKFILSLSYLIPSYPILSYLVPSYPILSCLILSYPIIPSYPILSCLIIPISSLIYLLPHIVECTRIHCQVEPSVG